MPAVTLPGQDLPPPENDGEQVFDEVVQSKRYQLVAVEPDALIISGFPTQTISDRIEKSSDLAATKETEHTYRVTGVGQRTLGEERLTHAKNATGATLTEVTQHPG